MGKSSMKIAKPAHKGSKSASTVPMKKSSTAKSNVPKGKSGKGMKGY